MPDLDDVSMYGAKYLVTKNEDSWLWHRRLGNIHIDLINKISSKYLLVRLPKIKFSKNKLCDAWQMGNQIRVVVSTSKPLEFLLLNLFVPSRTRSLDGNYYGFIIVNDYSRFTWTLLLTHKEETFNAFVKFVKSVQ